MTPSETSAIRWSRRQALWNILGLRLNRLAEACYRKARAAR